MELRDICKHKVRTQKSLVHKKGVRLHSVMLVINRAENLSEF